MDRLDKILAGTGRWSRREVKGLVRAGRVTVNGAVAGSPEQKYDRRAWICGWMERPLERKSLSI